MERSKLKYMSLLITMMMIFQIIILYAASGAEAHVENIFSNEDRGFKEIRITDRQYNGNRLNVGGTGIGNYSSIQLALASSSDGDRIIVHPGTYPEAVTVNTEVWIKGSGNAGLTNPGGLYNGFTLNANNITITGMNITDFLNGIFADTSSGHNISGNSFRGNFVNFAKMLTTIPLSVDLMDHGLTFTNNVMGYTSGNYVNFYYENEMYFDSVSMCNLTMGEILIKNNTFLDHSVQTNLFFRISISSIGGGGSVKVGDVQIVENEFHGGDIGIDIYMDSNSLANVSLEIGDLLIRDNMVLNYTVRGIEIDYWSFCKLYGTTSGTIGDCMISDNFLKTERVDALSININGFEYFREIRDSVSLVRGNFSILRNTIDSDRGTGIDITSIHTGYQIKGSSKILTGDLIIKENRIRNSSIGVFYRSGTIEEISGDTLFSKGNIIVEDNMMDTANVGIYLRLEALGYRMSGGSSVVLGDVIMRGNKIKAVDQGAQIFTSMLGHSLNDTASFSMGSISFTDNHVEAYHGYYNHYMGNIGRNLSNGSSFSFSDLNISSNTIISSSIGISFGIIEYLGTELYDHANFSFGSIIVDQNDIDSRDTGIRSNSIQMVGTTLGGTSSFSMGTLSVSRNKIISHGHSIHFGSIQSFGSNMMGGSKFEIEGFHFDGNDLRSNGTALHLDNIMEFGNFNFDLTSFIMGDVTINNNEIISGDDGVMINLIGNFGMDLHYRASFEMGSMIITNNAITTMSGNGIFLKDLLNFAVLLHDNSSMNMGSIKVGYNNVNSSLSGIKLGSIQFFGYQLWDWSKFEMGRLEFMDNGIISETGYGIHIPKIYNMGSCLNDRSSFHHEGIWIEDNTMEVNTSGVNIIGLGLLAQNVLHDSTVSMDGVHIVKNTMYSQNEGIEIKLLDIGIDSEDNSSIYLGTFDISGNEFHTEGYNKIELSGFVNYEVDMKIADIRISDNHFSNDGIYALRLDMFFSADNDGILRTGDQTIAGNVFEVGSGDGLEIIGSVETNQNGLADIGSMMIHQNVFRGCDNGLNITDHGSVFVFLNEFVNNVHDTVIDDSTITWISPEPMWYRNGMRNLSGKLGNYWDEYGGTDGDGDGIGDAPYNTGSGSDDRPLTDRVSEYIPPWNDITPPEVYILSPLEGSPLNYRDVIFEWEGSDDLLGIDHYEIRIDVGPWINVDMTPSHTEFSLSEGIHVFHVKAVDAAGNENVTSVSFFIDLTAPTGEITSPGDGSYVGSSSVLVTWTGEDELSGISHYWIGIDDLAWVKLGVELSFLFENITNGGHRIEVRLFDNAGNSLTISIEVWIDTALPSLSITYPTEGMFIGYSSVAVEWTAFDDISGLSGYWVKMNNGDWSSMEQNTSHLFTVLLPGNHTVSVRVVDGAGNTRTKERNFILGSVEKIISITSPGPGSYHHNDSIGISWSIFGMPYPMQMVQTSIDGGPFDNISIILSRSYFDLKDGLHTVIVKVIDRDGNFETDSVSFIIDTIRPKILEYSHNGDNAPPGEPLVISFSEIMGSLLVLINDVEEEGTWDNATLALTFDREMGPGRTIMVEVYGEDLAGNTLYDSHIFKTASKGTISGMVTDKDGEPVTDARVVLDSGEEDVTSEFGEFSIDAGPGTHVLMIYDSNGNKLGEFEVEIEAGKTSDPGPFVVDIKGEGKGSLLWLWLLIAIILIIIVVSVTMFHLYGRAEEDDEDHDYDDDWDDYEE